MNLRIPGPTPCPEDVLQAVGRQMINHRGPEFKDLVLRAHAGLQKVFQTKNDVLILTTSGTGGMEAAVVNTLSPGDKVLAASIGYFGDRFAEMAKVYGLSVTKLDFPQGSAADPAAVRKALESDPAIKAVLVTHNETSTGITNDLEAIAEVVRQFDKLLLVDAVSSLSCIPLPVDAWGCDVVVTASQKGFMVPPGLAFVSLSPKAWEASKQAKLPRYYFDLAAHKRYLERGQTPATPALSILFGLDLALQKLLQEGMPQVFQRHAHIAQQTRVAVKTLGLKLLAADERYASNTVTAVKLPDGVDGRRLLELLRSEYGTVLAGGQGALEGKIFRIGHLGYVSEQDIRQCLDALRQALPKVGFPVRVAAS